MTNNKKVDKTIIDKDKMGLREIFIEYGALIALFGLILFNCIFTKNFRSLNTVFLVIKQATPILFMTIGMTFVISSGGIDISTGSIMAFCGIIVSIGISNGGNFLLWTLIALLACALIGAFNGVLISKVGVQPIILSLVMQIVIRGVTVLMAKSSVFILGGYPEVKFLGLYRLPGRIPIQTVFFIAIIIISVFVLRKTVLGKYIEAMGSNLKASRLVGVDTVILTMTVYIISSVLAGTCGILEMCRNAALDPNELGKLYELDAIAGVAIGGTAMKGGKANIIGSIAGCIIMVLIGTTVNMNGIPFATANIMKALIIIVALAIQYEGRA